MSYWRLEAWWPLDQGLGTDKVAKLVGQPPHDAGAGFGQRDVGWNFSNEDIARAAYQKLHDAGYECACSEYDDHHRRKDK